MSVRTLQKVMFTLSSHRQCKMDKLEHSEKIASLFGDASYCNLKKETTLNTKKLLQILKKKGKTLLDLNTESSISNAVIDNIGSVSPELKKTM